MSTRDKAEAMLSKAIESTDLFGIPLILTSPDGLARSLFGDHADIGAVINPDVGTVMSGRAASITLRISSLVEAGFASLPKRINEKTSKPWLVSYVLNDIEYSMIVRESMPDRSAGVVVLILEEYTP